MEASDYSYPKATTRMLGCSLGRGAGNIRAVTIEAINPLKASAVVCVVGGGINALINTMKYKQGKITKRDAVLDTAGESVSMGLAVGVGLLESNM